MSVRRASIACLSPLIALSVFVSCKGDVDAIGGGPLGESDASTVSPEASASTPTDDAGASLDATTNDATAQVPACPECCAQCLVTLASDYALNLQTDGTYLYWDDGTSVRRMLLDGGAPSILASGRPGIRQLLISPTDIFWAELGTCDGGPLCVPQGTVIRMPIDGGSPVRLALDTSPAWAVAFDATRVYWSDEPQGDSGGGRIQSVPIDGGDTTQLAPTDGLAFGIAASSDGVYWLKYGAGCSGDDAGACVGDLMSVPFDGGPAAVYAGGLQDPGLLPVADGGVDFVTIVPAPAGASVITLSTIGGGPSTAVATIPSTFDSVIWDSANAYWTSNGTLTSTPRDGGASRTLAVGQNYPTDLLVTPTSLYWSDDPTSAFQAPYPTSSPDAGAIMMLTPK